MNPADVVRETAASREATMRPRVMTIPEAIEEALWLRRTPDGIVSPDVAKQTIQALLSALEASPCYFKAARLGIPTFVILAYDKAGHEAMETWASAARAHGCRPEKVDDVRAKRYQWMQRHDLKWPD